jgi:hypothetical protein
MFSTSIHAVSQEFEDTKGAIRIRISKRNRQHNGQKKKYKRTNNDQHYAFLYSSSLDIQYSFKTLKITYCCMRGYLQKYLHAFHESDNPEKLATQGTQYIFTRVQLIP